MTITGRLSQVSKNPTGNGGSTYKISYALQDENAQYAGILTLSGEFSDIKETITFETVV